jgi:hypothetical protein
MPQTAVITGASTSVSKSSTARWARRSIIGTKSAKSVYRAEILIDETLIEETLIEDRGANEPQQQR